MLPLALQQAWAFIHISKYAAAPLQPGGNYFQASGLYNGASAARGRLIVNTRQEPGVSKGGKEKRFAGETAFLFLIAAASLPACGPHA